MQTKKLILDTNVVSRAILPAAQNESFTCWLKSIDQRSGIELLLSAAVDYEIRRHLLCKFLKDPSFKGVQRLEQFRKFVTYLPILEQDWLEACSIWANKRNSGTPTGNDKSSDLDSVIAAQARRLEATVITENVKDFEKVVTCCHWQNYSCVHDT